MPRKKRSMLSVLDSKWALIAAIALMIVGIALFLYEWSQ